MGKYCKVPIFHHVNIVMLIFFYYGTNAVSADGFSDKIDSDSVARGEVQSCRGCSLKRLPEVRSFIYDDLPKYTHLVTATIDLTLPELEHLANHLTKDECHKLVAALHFDSFKLNQAVENAENAVPEDVTCLKLLLHWNSSPGEGLGETHERLSLRLRQIGRLDLATWLDSAVLEELALEMNGVVQDFQENVTQSETRGYQETLLEDELLFSSDDDEVLWDILTGIAPVVFVVLFGVVLFLIGKKFVQKYKLYRNSLEAKSEVRRKGSKLYEKL